MLKFVLSAALVAGVSAHQNFHQFWVNDVSPGYQVGIRMPPSNNPVVRNKSNYMLLHSFPNPTPQYVTPWPNMMKQTDVTSNDIVCNVGGTSGSGVKTVAAKAGDTIKVQWDSSTHPGPITHMLYGPVSSAASASGVGAGWFKIDEQNYVNGKWANEIMEAVGMTHTFKLPSNLKSGEYLVSWIHWIFSLASTGLV